jgi:hypothetical protein
MTGRNSDRLATLIGHMNLQSIRPLVLVISICAAATGCDYGNKMLGETAGNSDSESDSSDSESGSEALICAEFTDQAMCNAQGNDEIVCSWEIIDRAVRTGDVCEVEQVGYCMQDELFGDEAAGCGALAGCEDGPYSQPSFKITPEGVLLIDTCGGGTSEPGFEHCPTGEASADDPPECACACALAP